MHSDKHDWKKLLLMVWDTLFVLILCFVVLLTTMLLTRSAGGVEQSAYKLNVPILVGVAVSLLIYLSFMLPSSLKSLRQLEEHYFSAKDEEVEDK